MPRTGALYIAWLFFVLTVALAQPAPHQPVLEPFTINHEVRVDSPADVRFLLDAPAGKHGFIHVIDGHLATDTGHRIRLWGVNITGWLKNSALLPPKPEARLYAAELARLGVNCVRFQFLDLTTNDRPAGLIEGNRDDTRVMDPKQFDRLDYFIAQLKANGIYTDFNLNVGRRYKEGDGVRDYNLIGPAKAMTEFDPRLVELEKEYARQLLTHYNPYTRSEYRNEPAIAIVEIVNENSILEFWERNWLRGELRVGAPHYQLDLTPYYATELNADYNRWLAQTLTPAKLTHLRQIAGVGPGQPVPRLLRQEFDTAPRERFYTEAAFYAHVETHFLEEMRNYLKKTLGVKSLIIGQADHTYWIPGLPLLRSTSLMDIVDAHVYWQHPAISGRRNTPFVNDPLHSPPVKLTRSTIAGKPFTVSEVNEPFPNDYECELIPILAAYGAFQDWDGIFFYTFEPKLIGQWQPVIGDHFDISLDPVKIAELPVGALVFLRHDVRAARKTIERTYSTGQIDKSMRLPESDDPYFTPGFPLSLSLEHGSRVRCLDCEPTQKFHDSTTNPIRSDTGQLAWYTSDEKGGLVTIDTDRTNALVGFVKENHVATSHLSADIENPFCSIAVSSLDGKPLSVSSLLLLTATGRVENTGFVWDQRRANYQQWGTAPTLIEPITGWILLKNIEGAVAMLVTPLDGSARPIAELHGRRLEAGWEIPIGNPATTTYLVNVIRSTVQSGAAQ
jgi:hypothetical protein